MRFREITEAETVIDFDPQVSRHLFDLDLKANNGTLTAKDKSAFARFLVVHRMDYVTLYHGTSVKHDVQTNGLLPTSAKRRLSLQSGSGFVYLSYDPMRALQFARMGYPGQKQYVVYSAKVGIWQLLPDPDQLRNKRMWTDLKDVGSRLADSLIFGSGARFKGAIPSGQIAVYGYFDREGRRVAKPDEHGWNGATVEPRGDR